MALHLEIAFRELHSGEPSKLTMDSADLEEIYPATASAIQTVFKEEALSTPPTTATVSVVADKENIAPVTLATPLLEEKPALTEKLSHLAIPSPLQEKVPAMLTPGLPAAVTLDEKSMRGREIKKFIEQTIKEAVDENLRRMHSFA